MKIFLIGFMGAGKTSVGKSLAKNMGIDFIDLDTHIESTACKSINAIFHDLGEEKFREMERAALADLINKSNCVISTGGGTPCFHGNMKLMNANGKTIYLELTTNQILQRLTESRSKRPLLKDLSVEELEVFIEKKLLERSAVYQKSHHKIDAAHITNATNKILQLLE